ncbi:MAG: DUF2891 family protein [Candidatus Latescibacteria bacterium]|nr:DUF2891 family protein [bacterium]MBD3424149.1 DUF2891 family protein [Candidatus Latescibacterota bacterium]
METASNFARIALRCVHREYPNKLSHVMNDSTEVKPPSELHPAFYGCFDWHSSVHGHWMLVRLLKLFPELPEEARIREALDKNLSARNIRQEVAYLQQPSRKSFERTYGWSWLLKLSAELIGWDDPDGERWRKNLQPLAENIVKRYLDFLPRQTYPIRRGVHANTAFGLAFALDYAELAGEGELQELIVARSMDYYLEDTDCPGSWEPDGDDFLSSCLIEADLMARVLRGEKFAEWFHDFLPGLAEGEPENLLAPAVVSDRSDPKIVHLDGLNLSRAWCCYRIAASLPEDDPVRDIVIDTARWHASSAKVVSGNYEGEHWLASFAVYMLSVKREGGF